MNQNILDETHIKRSSIKKTFLNYWLPRLLAGILGIIFIIAAVLKSMDMELFIRQIKAYGIISSASILVLSAWGFIIIEFVLGACLLVGYRLGVSLVALGMLLVVFIFANLWALIGSTAADCGCFGSLLKRSPAEAIFEDIIFLIIAIISWARLNGVFKYDKQKGFVAVIIALLLGLILPVTFGYSVTGIFKPGIETAEKTLGKFEIQDLDNIDINSGEYLLVIMGTDCGHCQDAVFDLNILTDTENMPQIIALCTNDDDQIIRFKDEFQILFPIGKIEEDDFWELLGAGDMPRFMLVKDGLIKQLWNENVPSPDEILASLK